MWRWPALVSGGHRAIFPLVLRGYRQGPSVGWQEHFAMRQAAVAVRLALRANADEP